MWGRKHLGEDDVLSSEDAKKFFEELSISLSDPVNGKYVSREKGMRRQSHGDAAKASGLIAYLADEAWLSKRDVRVARDYKLHSVDDLDSQLNQLRRAAQQGGAGMHFLKGMGRYIYCSRNGDESEASEGKSPEEGTSEESPEAAAEPDEDFARRGPAEGQF